MKPPAERARNGLRFKMVIQCSSLVPYFVSTKLDKTCAQHEAKDEPPEQNYNRKRGFASGKRTHVQQWTKKNGQKTCFGKLYLPTIAIPFLSYMRKGHIKQPQNR